MNSIIIIIGNEVLSGDTLDTNSMNIGQALNNAGIPVIKKITIPDEKGQIAEALDEAILKADLIILSGGLGPTSDDITKQVISDYFNSRLVFNESVFENVKQQLKHRLPNLVKLSEDIALVPECAEILKNRLGTAPGLLIRKNRKIIIALPGIPYETEVLMKEQVIPWLNQKSNSTGIKVINRTIRTAGAPESLLSAIIKDIEEKLPSAISLAYLPHLGQVRLRLTAYGDNLKDISANLQPYFNSVADRLAEFVYGFDDEELPACIGRLLKERNATLSIAESCTGGFISHLITTVPGSSVYFKGSVTAYSNEIKIKELNIVEKILNAHGAVSQKTAEAMAKGIMKKFNTDYAVATTGIAGPDGGSELKPVGTLWMAAASKDKIISKNIVFDRGRLQNIEYFSVAALNMLRKLVIGNLTML